MSTEFQMPQESQNGTLQFKRRTASEPEINLIPFIDVLLVILIFLLLTTTYNQNLQLNINLPVASSENVKPSPQPLRLSVTANGDYALQGKLIQVHTALALSQALLARIPEEAKPVLIISADALSSHQSVITAIEAAQLAGISQISFALQAAQGSARP